MFGWATKLGKLQASHIEQSVMSIQSNPHETALVEMQSITKSYPGTLANDAIDLKIFSGRIHALLGENGAGKSTLVKILYGLLRIDAGHIAWQGQSVSIESPAQARELGIALVFQHFSLFDSLTVVENIALGMGVDANKELHQKIIDVSSRYGLLLDPDRDVYSLSVGERQRIEIVRCLLQSPKLLIMDEPTSVLTPQEVDDLFKTLRRLANEGMAILYISHKLNEIKALCSEATILRGGKLVATTDPTTQSVSSLAALMMGNEVTSVTRVERAPSNNVKLALYCVSLTAEEQHGVPLNSIELSVNAGEIVGIAGVAGNGQDELMQVISGEALLSRAQDLTIDNQPVGNLPPGARRALGLCCVPEERLGHASVPGMSLAENAFLTAHHRTNMRTGGFISHGKSKRFTKQVIDQFNVHCNGPQSLANSLSGGNLQKFIVGREIEQQPSVFVVSQPTWGVDAGAAALIHQSIQAMADQGAAVLVISQDLDELMLISDRIAALCAGSLSKLYPTSELSVQQLGTLMGGASIETGAVA